MHDVAPITSAGSDEVEISGQEKPTKTAYETALRQERVLSKWANMWKTIVLSSLKKTLFPYSMFIRTLRLQDLEDLLQDFKFQENLSKSDLV